MAVGNVVAVKISWRKSFALIPHRTLSGRWIWLQDIYKRQVWVDTGFSVETETQYGDLFDVMKE